MATKYAGHVSTRQTPVTQPIPGKNQVPNSTGGYAFAVDCWTRLNRFLILGNEGGSYYASERKLTVENAGAILECHAEDAKRTIDTIVAISEGGRAPKNDPAIFALAMLSRDPYALEMLNRVCRIGTHLFQFVDAAQHFRGRGRAFKRALQNWYLTKEAKDVAYQVTKYQQRDGWSHRDILRLCKPVTEGTMSSVLRWSVGKGLPDDTFETLSTYPDLKLIAAFEQAKAAATKKKIVKLITDHNLVRECIPTQWLNEPEVWEALLQNMPMTAMIRNLGKMSSIGLLKPMSKASQLVADRLQDPDRLKKARIHPLALLVAQRVYAAGRGVKGSLSWNVSNTVVDALDEAYYLSFKFVEPTGKRHLLALDISGSMGFSNVAGMPITPREASGAMAMTALRTEKLTHTMGFSHSFIELPLSKKMRLDEVITKISNIPFGATDISLPMKYALQHGIEVDAFVVYTDSEANCGDRHACQELQRYRDETGINAKLIVVGMASNGFTVADPNDAGMLDCVGFDTSAPAVMADFVRS